MKNTFLVLSFLFFGLSLYGQTALIVDDETKEYELFSISQRQVYDLDKDPGIEGVLNNQWSPPDELQLNQKNIRSAYYLKATVRNELDLQLICHLYYVSLSRIDVYQVVDGMVLDSAELGIYSYQQDFPFLQTYPMLELKETNGRPFDIILRLEGIQTAYISWFVSASKPFIEIRHYQDLFYGIIYGLLLLIIVYNLSLYYRLREIDNLIYALWILALAFHLAFFNGFIYEFVIPKWSGDINLVDVFGGVTSSLHIVFAVIFLKIDWKKLSGRIAIFIILWYVAGIVVTLTGQSEVFFPWLNPAFIVLIEGIYCIVVGIVALVRGFKPALYFIIANVLFYIFIGFAVAYGTGNMEHSFLGYHGFQIGSALEVLFFSFALSYKVRLLKKDKDEAMREKAMLAIENEKIVRQQNVILEQKVEERTKELREEQMRSENLLLNILPEQIAQELKTSGRARARRYEDVSIMFSDFVGFTSMAENLNPEELVEVIDKYFRKFDEIIEDYGLEKIKTIGDAYVAVANLPKKNENGEKQLAFAALAIRDYVIEESSKNPNHSFKIRTGINTGSVVAGVVGSKKFQFDIWGDAVNVAARMEETCEPGKINISESTYLKIKEDFICENRGMIEAKNKGRIGMYYLISPK